MGAIGLICHSEPRLSGHSRKRGKAMPRAADGPREKSRRAVARSSRKRKVEKEMFCGFGEGGTGREETYFLLEKAVKAWGNRKNQK